MSNIGPFMGDGIPKTSKKLVGRWDDVIGDWETKDKLPKKSEEITPSSKKSQDKVEKAYDLRIVRDTGITEPSKKDRIRYICVDLPDGGRIGYSTGIDTISPHLFDVRTPQGYGAPPMKPEQFKILNDAVTEKIKSEPNNHELAAVKAQITKDLQDAGFSRPELFKILSDQASGIAFDTSDGEKANRFVFSDGKFDLYEWGLGVDHGKYTVHHPDGTIGYMAVPENPAMCYQWMSSDFKNKEELGNYIKQVESSISKIDLADPDYPQYARMLEEMKKTYEKIEPFKTEPKEENSSKNLRRKLPGDNWGEYIQG